MPSLVLYINGKDKDSHCNFCVGALDISVVTMTYNDLSKVLVVLVMIMYFQTIYKKTHTH